MKKKLFLLAALTASCLAWAQEDSLSKSMDEVILIANKFEQKQRSTGKVVTVINKVQIEQYGGRSLLQLLDDQAGITVTGAALPAGSVHTIFMRGASTGRTLIMIDGIPVSDPSMIYNEFDLNLVPLSDIERIEICKGAQSTLYGSDAIAGVINIVTVKKGAQKPIHFDATLIAGNRNTMKTNLHAFGRLKKFSWSAGMSKHSTDGFSAAFDSAGNKSFDKDGIDSHGWDLHFQYEINPVWKIRALFKYNHYKAGVDGGSFADDKDYTIRNRGWLAGGGIDFKKGILQLTLNYRYEKNKRHYLNDSTDKPRFTSFEENRYESYSHFTELYSNIRLHDKWTVLLGADCRKSYMNQDYYSESVFGPYSSTFPETSLHQFSVYTSILFNALNKRLNIELGGRVNHHSVYGGNGTYTFNPSFSINQNWRIFASAASGYKTPSIFQAYDQFSGNPGLEAEQSVNYEAGIQNQSKKFNARLVWFHRVIRNGIDFDYIGFKYFNFIKQVANGVELETSIQPVKGFTIRFAGAFIPGREETQSRVTFNDTTYKYLLRRPRYSGNLQISYLHRSKLYMSLHAKFVSSRYDVGGFMEPDVKLGGYLLLNAYASYKLNKQVEFFADLQNITNTRFFDISGFSATPFLVAGGIRVKL